MKVLCLADYQLSYGYDGLMVGLNEVGGVEYSEYPIRHSLRGAADQGYELPDGSTNSFTGCGGYLQRNPLPYPKATEEEVFDTFPNFDLIVMDTRDHARRGIKALCEKKNIHSSDLPLVMVDMEDHDSLDVGLIARFQPKIVYKRELGSDNSLEAYREFCSRPVFPLPFSAFTRGYPNDIDDTRKTLDIFCSLGNTNPIRLELLKKLIKAGIESRADFHIATNDNVLLGPDYDAFRKPMLSWDDYIRTQAQSRIGASVVGFGRDCLHLWEMMSFATLALVYPTGLHMPYPFKDKEHCIYFQDLEAIPFLVNFYLNEPEAAEEIAKAGKQWCRTWHSNRARAQYLLDISTKILSGEKINKEEYGL